MFSLCFFLIVLHVPKYFCTHAIGEEIGSPNLKLIRGPDYFPKLALAFH